MIFHNIFLQLLHYSLLAIVLSSLCLNWWYAGHCSTLRSSFLPDPGCCSLLFQPILIPDAASHGLQANAVLCVEFWVFVAVSHRVTWEAVSVGKKAPKLVFRWNTTMCLYFSTPDPNQRTTKVIYHFSHKITHPRASHVSLYFSTHASGFHTKTVFQSYKCEPA